MTITPVLAPQQVKDLIATLQNAKALAGQSASLRMASDEERAEVRSYLEKINEQLHELDELCASMRKLCVTQVLK